VGCSKNFRGKSSLDTFKKVCLLITKKDFNFVLINFQVEYWLKQLSDELEERLEKDKLEVR
jgi:hypothetical protein